MKQAPQILITPCTQNLGAEFGDRSLSLSYRYVEAVLAAGGIPWVIPIDPEPDRLKEYVRRCDGVLLTGGVDVQPDLYAPEMPAQLRREASPPDPPRDFVEFFLVQECLGQQKPLLAICRGQQVLNVALGGTLVVDIATEMPGALNHRQLKRKDELVHEVTLIPGSLLAQVLGQTAFKVNSTHHQAVARLAPPLRATATSPDGMVEALEMDPIKIAWSPFFLAVQFHPERLWHKYPMFLAIFNSFVRACRSRRNGDL
jgi:putative glutamine amidotransferase